MTDRICKHPFRKALGLELFRRSPGKHKDHFTPQTASLRDSEDDLGSIHRKTLNNESCVEWTRLPEREGLFTLEVFNLEFNHRMTKMLQKGFLLGLERVRLEDF